jgi:hypothetical protein
LKGFLKEKSAESSPSGSCSCTTMPRFMVCSADWILLGD